MAGVSLALKKVLGSRSVLEQTAGYAYAGMAMAGPWLLTALTMGVLGALSPMATGAERRELQALVIYSYAASTLITGLVQLAVARTVSDRLFEGRVAEVFPVYAGAVAVSLVLHQAMAAGTVALVRPPLLLALAELAFFGSLGWVWIGMIFVGAIRRFALIALAFALGLAAGLAAALSLAPRFGTAGSLAGLALGHALIGAFFTARLRVEFPAGRAFDFGFFRTAARFPALLLAGVAYAAGLWADKVVFWLSSCAAVSPDGLRTCPIYDNAVYLACLTTIPSLAVVFIRFEVAFSERCRAFYRAVRLGAPLASIRACRDGVAQSFRESLWRVVRLQGPVTLLAVLWAPALLDVLGLDWVQYYAFRLACLSAFLQALLLALFLACLHLALYRLALGLVLLYGTLNAGLTLAGTAIDLPAAFLGPILAGLAALVTGYPLLSGRLARLDRETFMAQPR